MSSFPKARKNIQPSYLVKNNECNRIVKFVLNFFAIIISIIAVFTIMYKANWVFGDDTQYISTTAVNKYSSALIFDGRFIPLWNIHYNLPLFVLRCIGINTGLPVEAHFAVVAIVYIITIFCLYSLFNKIELVKTSGIYSVFNHFFPVCFFLLGTFHIIYLEIIYIETVVIMLFSVFMLFYYKALKTDDIRYYAVAFISAVFCTYCKEPVFGALLIIAFVNYLFRSNSKTKKETIFYIVLIANGVIFIILYYFLSFKNTAGFYNQGRVFIGGFEFLQSIFKMNPILAIMFCFGLIRLYFVIVRKEKSHLFYDSLLFAGIGYVFAYFMLHLNESYYYLPSIILFLPSLVHWTKYLFEKKRICAIVLLVVLLPLCINNFKGTQSWVKDLWQQRQDFMPYIADLLSEHNNGKEFIWFESDIRTTDDTFYIAVRDWQKYVENAFLNYLNKSEGIDFFVVKNIGNVIMNPNVLFFYSDRNDQGYPMQMSTYNLLRRNNFIPYKYCHGVWTFRQY